MAKKVAQMIEEQVQSWIYKNISEHKSTPAPKIYPIITVSREFGAKGAALAALIGEKLDFKVWDKDLLLTIGKWLGSDPKLFETLDESRRKSIEDAIFGFMNHPGTNLSYMRSLTRAVRTIEKFGNSIIVGRGANYICQSPSSFHIRVVSALNKRILNYAESEKITKEQAAVIIKQKDAERADFIKYNFNKEVSDSRGYDLVVNSGAFNLEELADIVIYAYEKKIKQSVAAIRK